MWAAPSAEPAAGKVFFLPFPHDSHDVPKFCRFLKGFSSEQSGTESGHEEEGDTMRTEHLQRYIRPLNDVGYTVSVKRNGENVSVQHNVFRCGCDDTLSG